MKFLNLEILLLKMVKFLVLQKSFILKSFIFHLILDTGLHTKEMVKKVEIIFLDQPIVHLTL